MGELLNNFNEMLNNLTENDFKTKFNKDYSKLITKNGIIKSDACNTYYLNGSVMPVIRDLKLKKIDSNEAKERIFAFVKPIDNVFEIVDTLKNKKSTLNEQSQKEIDSLISNLKKRANTKKIDEKFAEEFRNESKKIFDKIKMDKINRWRKKLENYTSDDNEFKESQQYKNVEEKIQECINDENVYNKMSENFKMDGFIDHEFANYYNIALKKNLLKESTNEIKKVFNNLKKCNKLFSIYAINNFWKQFENNAVSVNYDKNNFFTEVKEEKELLITETNELEQLLNKIEKLDKKFYGKYETLLTGFIQNPEDPSTEKELVVFINDTTL